MPNNVIQGPWGKEPPELNAFDEEEKNALLVHALAVDISSAAFDSLIELGFDNLEEACYIKDMAMIVQAIKSAIYRMQDREHPVQKIADSLLDWTDDGYMDIKPEFEE